MTTWVLLLLVLLASSVKGSGLIEKGKQLAVSWYNKALNILPKFSMRALLTRFFHFDNNVFFILYKRNCDPKRIVVGDIESLSNSCLNPNVKTKILIHGWLSAENNYYSDLMKKAYLEAHDYNVIAVDWSWYSYNFYTIARFSIDYVAPEIAKFVEFILGAGIDPDDIHILGHSLGAHIAGLAGYEMKINVSRITGMDPAMPLIFGDSSHRLDATDAQFVDIIHTSKYTLGVYEAYGHADFYPNGGGPLQPGCGLEFGICTHSRSYRYFIESIHNEKGFMAVRCDGWWNFTHQNCSNEYAYMGEGVSHLARGKFYLRTATKPPYALGDIWWRTNNIDESMDFPHASLSATMFSALTQNESFNSPTIENYRSHPNL
uniref:Pancreatic triacylglycerol lipase n=1 Tax=Lygus hesperus TaxID=30085 RepID=A0A0A9XLC9_LYGHE